MPPFQRAVRAADGVEDDEREQRDYVGLLQAAAFKENFHYSQYHKMCEVEK